MPEPSEQTRRDALAVVEAFEAAAFRAAHVARQLLADHPDLPVWQIRPSLSVRQGSNASAELDIWPWTIEGVSAWATALGTTVERTFYDALGSAQAFERHEAVTTIGGVEVTVHTSRHDLSPDELAAWRARQERNAAGGEG